MAVGIASTPQAKMKLRGRLGILISTVVGVCSLECTDHLSVNRPCEDCRTPVNCVGVEFVDWVVHVRLCATIPVSSDALAEVIGLNLAALVAKVVSRPFPVNLILVI